MSTDAVQAEEKQMPKWLECWRSKEEIEDPNKR